MDPKRLRLEVLSSCNAGASFCAEVSGALLREHSATIVEPVQHPTASIEKQPGIFNHRWLQ